MRRPLCFDAPCASGPTAVQPSAHRIMATSERARWLPAYAASCAPPAARRGCSIWADGGCRLPASIRTRRGRCPFKAPCTLTRAHNSRLISPCPLPTHTTQACTRAGAPPRLTEAPRTRPPAPPRRHAAAAAVITARAVLMGPTTGGSSNLCGGVLVYGTRRLGRLEASTLPPASHRSRRTSAEGMRDWADGGLRGGDGHHGAAAPWAQLGRGGGDAVMHLGGWMRRCLNRS